MRVCYDLARCPPTFDVVAFLAMAELYRKRIGEREVHVSILPGPDNGFRRDSLWPRTVEGRRHMRDNVLVPICHMLPTVKSVTVEDRPRVDGWGHGAYHVGLPTILEALRGDCRPLHPTFRDRVFFNNYDVTFTLREAAHHPLRNSRVSEWLKAAWTLHARGVSVAIVPDASHADLPMDDAYEGLDVFPGAATSIDQRAALYASSRLNVGVSNGPMWLAIFMNAPVLMLRPTTNVAGGCYDDAFFSKCGLRPGAQLPTSPSHQKLVWREEDTEDVIVHRTLEMLEEVS